MIRRKTRFLCRQIDEYCYWTHWMNDKEAVNFLKLHPDIVEVQFEEYVAGDDIEKELERLYSVKDDGKIDINFFERLSQ